MQPWTPGYAVVAVNVGLRAESGKRSSNAVAGQRATITTDEQRCLRLDIGAWVLGLHVVAEDLCQVQPNRHRARLVELCVADGQQVLAKVYICHTEMYCFAQAKSGAIQQQQ